MKYYVTPRSELEQDPLRFGSLSEAVECAKDFTHKDEEMVVLVECASVINNRQQPLAVKENNGN